ncbi:MAG: hypothetical protein Q7S19_01675 [bacterium]|nr:hypothetical protein [bacterium]
MNKGVIQATRILSVFGNSTENRVQALVDSGVLADILESDPTKVDRNELRKFLGLTPTELEVLIDYTQTLEQMITAGHYDWANSDITAKRFPLKGEGKVARKAYLVHFDHGISSENAIKELDKQGKRPATIEELLAFGAKYPEIQRKFPVVALGSSAKVDGDRSVAYLDRYGSARRLHLVWWDGDWNANYRFLAFAK